MAAKTTLADRLRAELTARDATVATLERTMGHLVGERDRALGAWSTASSEASARRHQRDEVAAALGVALAVLETLSAGQTIGPDDGYRLRQATEMARLVFDRYRPRRAATAGAELS